MKLSKEQQRVYEKAKADIDRARQLDYPEWLKATHPFYQGETEYQKKCYKEALEKEEMKKYWEEAKRGIVCTWCNSRTLEALEKQGLIKVLYDSKNGGCIDDVQVLNY